MNESNESFLAWKLTEIREKEARRLIEKAGLDYDSCFEQTKKLARYVVEENSKLATQLHAAAVRLDALYKLPPAVPSELCKG